MDEMEEVCSKKVKEDQRELGVKPLNIGFSGLTKDMVMDTDGWIPRIHAASILWN